MTETLIEQLNKKLEESSDIGCYFENTYSLETETAKEIFKEVVEDLTTQLTDKIDYWFDLFHSGQICDRDLVRFLKIDIKKQLGAKKHE
jgi:hypothetical protein